MRVVIAANNGDIGGGEVMLLAIARAVYNLGHDLEIVGPSQPDELVAQSRALGYKTVELEASSRLTYMIALRSWWRQQSSGILWCNGLLPSVATAGMRRRLVHLHQIPVGRLKFLFSIARRRSLGVLVPSKYLSLAVKHSKVLSNWSNRISTRQIGREAGNDFIRVGFIGRFSSDKGLPILIKALEITGSKAEKPLKLVLAGSPKFVSEMDQRTVRSAIESSEVAIELLGWVAPQDVLSEVDVVVVPSIWPESFGLVAAECMSASVPLVVSDAGALPEIVGEGYPWVSRAGDVNSLAESITKFLSASKLERDKVVNAAFKRWSSLYSPETGQRAVGRILQEIEGK